MFVLPEKNLTFDFRFLLFWSVIVFVINNIFYAEESMVANLGNLIIILGSLGLGFSAPALPRVLPWPVSQSFLSFFQSFSFPHTHHTAPATSLLHHRGIFDTRSDL